MKKLNSAEVRQMFLDFFAEKGHRVEPSASLVPNDDPTLLWINSGVATLKKYFDGTVTPENPRIVNAQKSIRTNDIENVGYTARHHTFFEMLGNFSIGDYFKKEAILWAWEFLTSEKWLGFDEKLLYVTVHPEDDEAYDIWLKEIKLPVEHIIRIEENFWDIGEGPSGPNTEIFYDRGEKYGNDSNDPELYPGGENERYLEVWNLVFSQFNHNPDDSYTPLPNKNIDTGMGLERMMSIIQDTPTNFETDLFQPILSMIGKLANQSYGTSKDIDTAYKVVADHIRTLAFAIGDGALPSNEGRGYVLRRLLRRAVRYAKQIGIEKPFMYELVPTVGGIMKNYYPEVAKQEEYIAKIIKIEEERFYETLNDGLNILADIIDKEKENNSTVFPGDIAFKLYDTYGFPKELTEEYIAEHGFTLDETGFQVEMDKQRERARNARKQVESMQVQDEVFGKLDATSEFIGYDILEKETTVVSILKDKAFVKTAKAGEKVLVVLAETPFYAESGGQIADKGIISADGLKAIVEDVKKAPKGQHIHHVTIEAGELVVGGKVTASIKKDSRLATVKNHTATHLLHQALKDVLGEHVNQAGSLVTSERLRFDFSHFSQVSEEELKEVEQIVNEKIWQSVPLDIRNMKIAEAKEIGAMALFGEKYGDIVRVVRVGDYSIELCGGCHVVNTAEIGLFKIISEGGIGAGTRRIEAVTSQGAYEFINKQVDILNQVSQKLKVTIDHVPNRIDQLNDEMKALSKTNESLSAKLAHLESASVLDKQIEVEGVNLLATKVNAKDMNQLRNMFDDLKEKMDTYVILLAAENGSKVQLLAGVSKDNIEKGLHAGNLIKEAAKLCGGGGGGRPDMAQAGGKNPSGIEQAIQFAEHYIKENKK